MSCTYVILSFLVSQSEPELTSWIPDVAGKCPPSLTHLHIDGTFGQSGIQFDGNQCYPKLASTSTGMDTMLAISMCFLNR